MLPKLAKEDSMVSLPLKDIFALYGKTIPDTVLCHETHIDWEHFTNCHIMVYTLTDGEIKYFGSQISISFPEKNQDHEIKLIANSEHDYDQVCFLLRSIMDYYRVIIVYYRYLFYIIGSTTKLSFIGQR